LIRRRRFRVLAIVDDVTRECLAAIPDTSTHATEHVATKEIEPQTDAA
jgi:hypothetical protein